MIKRLSILGDSISTYKGFSNDKSVNSTLSYNIYHYFSEHMPPEKTYWRIVMDSLGLSLCVNNSYSGGLLSGRDNTNSGVNRVNNLSRDDGTEPDFIIVFMGINDLGRGISPSVFAKDYAATLSVIKEKYKDAYVCCVNIPDRDEIFKERAILFNEAISEAVKDAGERFFVADLFASRLNNDFYYINTMDGLHPDEDGMKIIAEVILNSVKENIK